ncbi:MAG: FtsB family cell division protein [Syntrophothermus sp.]
MNILKKILRIFINKYFLITVAFVVWMFFFDSNSVINRRKTKEKLMELKQEKKFYLQGIRNDSVLNQNLLNDSLALEKFAREKYLMKKPNEDVYLIIDTSATADPRQ